MDSGGFSRHSDSDPEAVDAAVLKFKVECDFFSFSKCTSWFVRFQLNSFYASFFATHAISHARFRIFDLVSFHIYRVGTERSNLNYTVGSSTVLVSCSKPLRSAANGLHDSGSPWIQAAL